MRIIVPATETAVRSGLASITTGLASFKLNQEDISNAEIVFAEILNNIVEHAYIDHINGLIEVTLTHNAAGLWCSVVDEGKAMPGNEPPIGHPPCLDCATEDLPEGGFGWFLIRELTQDLAYKRVTEKNHLSFRMPTDLSN